MYIRFGALGLGFRVYILILACIYLGFGGGGGGVLEGRKYLPI